MEQARLRPTEPAYYTRTSSGWVPRNWKEYADETRQAARALLALKQEKGYTVSILGFNKPEWTIMDLAIMCIGGVAAGIYTTCSPNEVQYIIDHAESEVVLLENRHQWEKVNEERHNLPNLKHIVMMRDSETIEDEMAMTWEEFLAKGDKVDDAEVDRHIDELESFDLATFIYTSGTTGPPKAVMLTHENLAWTATQACNLINFGAGDTSVSYLPLSHIAEQVFTIHGPITGGSAVFYAESIDKLRDNLLEVQPTVMFGVPRIWEKFHAGVSSKLKEATGIKAKIAAWAQGVGTRVTALRNKGQKPGFFLQLQYNFANKRVFSPLRERIGLKNLRMGVSGAAPIAAEVLEFFAGFDIIIHEVYGQSEDTGPTSFNVPGNTRFGTVGPAFPGVTIKIAEDDEILVSGPNVFAGYYKDPAATSDTLVDGWLHSGDLGKIDSNGFLHITGRKKDIIITAGGKNIAPKNIEAALKNTDLVAEAVVIGDRRKFLSALLTLDEEAVAKFAASKGVSGEALHENETVLAEIQKGVDGVNSLFARVEHIRKFKVLSRNFSIEAGELTPTLKIKRRIINQNYAEEIESIYAD
jgi:long-chain acyl-CoA synthetase